MQEDPFAERPAPGELVIPLHAEQVEIGRVRRETTVKIATVTGTREQLVEEVLAQQHAHIVRVDIGTIVDAMPEVRYEGDTTIVPVVEEILVVEKKLFLKEEIRITRERATSVHRETVVLREQHAVVTRTPGDDTRLSAQPNRNGDQDG